MEGRGGIHLHTLTLLGLHCSRPPKLGAVWGLLSPIASFQLGIDHGNEINGSSPKTLQAAGSCKWREKMGFGKFLPHEETIAGRVDSVCLPRVERGSSFWLLEFPAPQAHGKKEKPIFHTLRVQLGGNAPTPP